MRFNQALSIGLKLINENGIARFSSFTIQTRPLGENARQLFGEGSRARIFTAAYARTVCVFFRRPFHQIALRSS